MANDGWSNIVWCMVYNAAYQRHGHRHLSSNQKLTPVTLGPRSGSQSNPANMMPAMCSLFTTSSMIQVFNPQRAGNGEKYRSFVLTSDYWLCIYSYPRSLKNNTANKTIVDIVIVKILMSLVNVVQAWWVSVSMCQYSDYCSLHWCTSHSWHTWLHSHAEYWHNNHLYLL